MNRRIHLLIAGCIIFLRLSAPGKSQEPAVVSIFTYDLHGKPSHDATGFFVSPDGKFATTRHALDDTSKAVIQMNDGREYRVAGIVAEDPLHDLVLLQVEGSEFPFLKLGAFQSVRKDNAVQMIITPLMLKKNEVSGAWATASGGRTVNGSVERVENPGSDGEWFSIRIPTVEGESGSPVLDGQGDVIGMVWGGAFDHNSGATVSVDYIKELLAAPADAGGPRPLSALKKRKYGDLHADADFIAAADAAWRGDNKEALRRMQIAVKDFPESGGFQMVIGSYYSRLMEWKEAAAAFGNAARIKPDNATAWASLAMVLAYELKPDAALDACKKAVALKPDDEDAWFNIGGTYVLLKQYDDARVTIRRLRDLKTPEATNDADKLTAALERAIAQKADSRLAP